MKKILIIIALTLCIFQMAVLATAIDIGSPAVLNDSNIASGTYVDTVNPANDTGTITSIEIWAGGELQGVQVATFFVVSGNNLSTRDTVDLANVAAGSKQTITVDSGSNPISLNVVTGDYIGIYFSAGSLRYLWNDGSLQSYNGDAIPCTDVTFAPLTRKLSLYGTGATAATFALVKFNNITITKWNELAILKWNNKNIP